MATHRFRAVSSANVDCRRAERLFVSVARVVDRAGAPIEAVLCDVSRFGCRLSAPGDYVPGERLCLRIGGGMAVEATVVWGDGGVIGCRFDEAVSRVALRQLTLGWG